MKNPHIVFIVLDTVRFDRLSFNGYGRKTTPNLDALAQKGLVFKQAFSTAPWTVPSHTSMFSGRYPIEHHANQLSLKVRTELPLLAEVLQKEAGYETFAYTTNDWFDPLTGLTRGFQKVYGDPVRKSRKFRRKLSHLKKRLDRLFRTQEQTITQKLIAQMIDSLQQGSQRGKPQFLFANFMDAHLPLRPSKGSLQQFVAPADFERASQISTPAVELAYAAGTKKLTPKDFEILSDVYDAALYDLDAALATLFDYALCTFSSDLDNDILLIITADHGENLGEHNLMGHQLCLYDTLLHVPLLIYGTDLEFPGIRDDLVQLTDVYHTILSEVGIQKEQYAVNANRNLCSPSYQPHDVLIAEYARPQMTLQALKGYVDNASKISHFDHPITSWRTEEYKYIYKHAAVENDELYDLREDPEEKVDIAQVEVEKAAEMREALLNWRQQMLVKIDGAEMETAVLDDLDDELVERLKGLGYL